MCRSDYTDLFPANSDETTPLRIFVYGTLKPGECNYDKYCNERVSNYIEGFVKGVLYDIPYGYPGMVDDSGMVKGYLLIFKDPEYLKDIDFLEGYDPDLPEDKNLYKRKWVEVFDTNLKPLCQAWTYYMKPERARELGGKILNSDCWNSEAKNSFDHSEHVKFLDQMKNT